MQNFKIYTSIMLPPRYHIVLIPLFWLLILFTVKSYRYAVMMLIPEIETPLGDDISQKGHREESHLGTTTSTVATTTIVGMLQAAPENLQKKELNGTDGSSATALPDQLPAASRLMATLLTVLLIFTSTLL
ncbi:hypothetical protein quinque_008070 [Culex quinquefasciatus]